MGDFIGTVIGYIFIGILIILLIVAFFAIIDVIFGDFHIYNYVDMSARTQYRGDNTFSISDRKEFAESYADYLPTENSVLYVIYNNSKDPYDFKGATFSLLDKDWKMYKLKLVSVDSSDYRDGSYILNPDGQLQILCETPRIIYNIVGFRIWKSEAKNNVNMRFGYLPRPFWKKFYENTVKPFCKKLSLYIK